MYVCNGDSGGVSRSVTEGLAARSDEVIAPLVISLLFVVLGPDRHFPTNVPPKTRYCCFAGEMYTRFPRIFPTFPTRCRTLEHTPPISQIDATRI